jgi:hypothetical protein
MLKGSIYVVGTPQYLSSRFGTEWRIDVVLSDDREETHAGVSEFLSANLPSANLVNTRGLNLLYAIPADVIEIAPLFRVMKNAVVQEIGIKHFTCSSTTLEKVFLDLVMRSEIVAEA